MRPLDVMRARGITAGSGSWSTTFTDALTSSSSGWDGYTLRVVIPTSAISAGSKVRVTLKAAGTGAAPVIINAYIGVSGTPEYAFTSTPIQLKFSGSAGVTIATGSSVTSDAADLAVSGSSKLVLSVAFSAGNIAVATTGPGWGKYEKFGSDAANVSPTSYLAGANAPYFVAKIEIFSP